MTCPICYEHMDSITDPGDPDNGYAGGDQSFRCSSDRCVLGDSWYTDAEVRAEMAKADRVQGDAA